MVPLEQAVGGWVGVDDGEDEVCKVDWMVAVNWPRRASRSLLRLACILNAVDRKAERFGGGCVAGG